MGSVEIGCVVMNATLIHRDKWVPLDTDSNDPVVARGGETARSYLERKLSDPSRRARMAALRREIGQGLVSQRSGRETIATLRMQAGLSQTALAEKMGTQQPNIARWEKSPTSMQFENVVKLAGALGMPIGKVASVMEAQMSTEPQHLVGTSRSV